MAARSADTPWTAEGAEKRAAVQRLFHDIAPTYDLLNSLLSFRLHHRWRAKAVRMLNLKPGDSALDVCSGTGDFLSPLRKAVGTTGRVVGSDFCLPMLDRSRAKFGEPLALADACALPFQDGKFDAVTVGWGIRNVPDIDAAHRELARVLKPGGRFVSVDMAQPRNRLVRSASKTAFRTLSPLLGKLAGQEKAYTYLPESTQRFWDRDGLARSMERAGFKQVETFDLLLGNICIHFGVKA